MLKSSSYHSLAIERIPEFVRAVRAFLFRNRFVFRNFATITLCDLLQDYACETTLDFWVENDSDILVDRFDTDAVHVFDEEPRIQASMKRRRMVSGDQPITYCFANSRSEPAI